MQLVKNVQFLYILLLLTFFYYLFLDVGQYPLSKAEEDSEDLNYSRAYVPKCSFMSVHWTVNSWLEVEIEEGAALIISAQWRIFFICSSYSNTGRPIMDSKEDSLQWPTNIWISISHEKLSHSCSISTLASCTKNCDRLFVFYFFEYSLRVNQHLVELCV